jgi:hypothetical protein
VAPRAEPRQTSTTPIEFPIPIQAGKATHRPHIPSIAVDNARKGFFEPADFEAVRQNLSESMRKFVRFLYLTG